MQLGVLSSMSGGSLPVPKRLRGSTPSHARASNQEKQTAGKYGGRLVPGSGGAPKQGRKEKGNRSHVAEAGDVRIPGVARIECKTTKHASFSVTSEMIDKIETATFGADEIPVIEVELELGKKRVYVVPEWAMDLLLDAAKKS